MQNPYNFDNVVAVKLLIKKGETVLLLREPLTNEWMPGRLGLPGGKPVLNEKLSETLERKIKTEVGLHINVLGIVKLIDIIMPTKTVYHIVLAAEYIDGKLGQAVTESDELKWFEATELAGLSKNDFTEYYNDLLLKDFLAGELPIVPMSMIAEQDNRDEDVMKWMDGS